MLDIVASGLKGLLSEAVFVGGAVASLYIQKEKLETVSAIRPTDDVDCVVEIASRSEYYKLERKLRGLGFKNSTEANAPVCRWLYSGVTVDIMPTDPKIVGFANFWYKPGMENSIFYRLPSKLEIKIFSFPYFLASKIEAFKDRGKGDFFGSRDFEDIVTVLEGRASLRTDFSDVQNDLRVYLQNWFQERLSSADFIQGLSYHLASGKSEPDNTRRLLDILKNI